MRLQARDLSYSVGDRALVAGIELGLADRELVAVVGPNGAGKSTLVRLLSGDLPPTTGAIQINGDAMADLPVDRLAMERAYLPQTHSPDVPFAVDEVIRMGRYPYRLDPANSVARDVAAVHEAMAVTEVESLADRAFATLSGGEQMRVSLARVLAQDASLMLLDEPTTALDPHHQEGMMGVLADRAHAGKAVLAVLHDLNLAAAYADRMILMSEGRIAAEGIPAAVLSEDLLVETYRMPLRVIAHPFRESLLVLTTDE